MIDLLPIIGYDKDNIKCMPWGVSVLLQDMVEYSDHQLASLVCQDDPDAFVELTKRYMSLIRAKAAAFHNTVLEADDLYQGFWVCSAPPVPITPTEQPVFVLMREYVFPIGSLRPIVLIFDRKICR